MRKWVAGLCACIASSVTIASLATGRASEEAPRDRALAELGRRLFFDPSAGRSGRFACSACHDPERGFADSRATPQDERGHPTLRAPSLEDLGDGPLGWDGAFESIRDAIDDHLLEPRAAREAAIDRAAARFDRSRRAGLAVDAGLLQWMPYEEDRPRGPGDGLRSGVKADLTRITPVEFRLAQDGRYDAFFDAAFESGEITRGRIVDALTAYVRTLRSADSPFDRFRAGDETAMSESARRGLTLFEGRARCAECHATDASRATLTDWGFHDVGIGVKAGRDGAATPPDGRMSTSFVRADRGAFRTPSLRDVGRRGPFFHDGSAATLEDVVRYYARGGNAHAGLDPRIAPFDVSDSDVADLVAFLGALTGEDRAGLAPPAAASRVKLHVERLSGTPFAGLTIDVRPAGDRPRGTARGAPRYSLVTDEDGNAEFEHPASTHVLVTSNGYELGLSRLIPEGTKSMTLLATPLDTLSVRVRRAPGRPFPQSFTIELPKSDRAPVGRGGTVCADASDFPLTLRLVRTLSPGEALYAMPKPGFSNDEPTVMAMDFGTPSAPAPRHEFDLRGGASETIDEQHSEPIDAGRTDRDSPSRKRLEALVEAARAASPK